MWNKFLNASILAGVTVFSLVFSQAASQRGSGDASNSFIEINLKTFKISQEDFPKAVFARDGQAICIWWAFGDHGETKCLILDLSGRKLCDSRDASVVSKN